MSAAFDCDISGLRPGIRATSTELAGELRTGEHGQVHRANARSHTTGADFTSYDRDQTALCYAGLNRVKADSRGYCRGLITLLTMDWHG